MEADLALAVLTDAAVPAPLSGGVPWRLAVDTFLDRLDNEGTKRAYRRALLDAFEFIGRPTLAELAPQDLTRYRKHLLSRKPERSRAGEENEKLAPASVCRALAAVRAFLSWARKPSVGALPLSAEVIADELRSPKGETVRPYEIVGEAEIPTLFAAAKTARDRAILAVALGAGLRVSELAALHVSHLSETSTGGAFVRVVCGKGSKDRTAKLAPDAWAIVRAYLAESGRTVSDSGPLFRAHDRGAARRNRRAMSARALADVVKGLVLRAGIEGKHLSPHSLRHTFATRLVEAGVHVVAVSKLLGHSSLAPTMRYVAHVELGRLELPAFPVAANAR